MCFQTAVSGKSAVPREGVGVLGHFQPPAGREGLEARWGGASPRKEGDSLLGRASPRRSRVNPGLPLYPKKGLY